MPKPSLARKRDGVGIVRPPFGANSKRTIAARFPADLVDAICRLAGEHDRSVSGEIIRAVREYVQREAAQSE